MSFNIFCQDLLDLLIGYTRVMPRPGNHCDFQVMNQLFNMQMCGVYDPITYTMIRMTKLNGYSNIICLTVHRESVCIYVCVLFFWNWKTDGCPKWLVCLLIALTRCTTCAKNAVGPMGWPLKFGSWSQSRLRYLRNLCVEKKCSDISVFQYLYHIWTYVLFMFTAKTCVLVARRPRGNIQREAKDKWRGRILGIGKLIVCHAWELSPWPNSLSNPFKP